MKKKEMNCLFKNPLWYLSVLVLPAGCPGKAKNHTSTKVTEAKVPKVVQAQPTAGKKGSSGTQTASQEAVSPHTQEAQRQYNTVFALSSKTTQSVKDAKEAQKKRNSTELEKLKKQVQTFVSQAKTAASAATAAAEKAKKGKANDAGQAATYATDASKTVKDIEAALQVIKNIRIVRSSAGAAAAPPPATTPAAASEVNNLASGSPETPTDGGGSTNLATGTNVAPVEDSNSDTSAEDEVETRSNTDDSHHTEHKVFGDPQGRHVQQGMED